jgi:membrane associated rhomboid family serine protease
MLLPFSIVGATVRRWPVVTFAIIALNFVCFLGELAAWRSSNAEVNQDYRNALAYQAAHPYLEAPALLLVRSRAAKDPPLALPDGPVPDDHSEADVEEEQQQLDRLCARIGVRLKADPIHRFGFIPKDGAGVGMITYMFLHTGVLHLLGNLWFLWLASASIEDRWGRLTFSLFYLSSGVVAALAHMAAAPQSGAPLVGASGAIAGAMGAFLVLFSTRRIRFAYLFGLRFGHLAAPAYVMLPAWIVAQVFFARFVSGDGVAYWAHVGGFVFGATVAGVFRVVGADERLEAWVAESA